MNIKKEIEKAMQIKKDREYELDEPKKEAMEFILARHNGDFIALCGNRIIDTFCNDKNNYKIAIMSIEEFALDLGLLKLFNLPTSQLEYYLYIINEEPYKWKTPWVELEVAKKWKDEAVTKIRCWLEAYIGKLFENDTKILIYSHTYFYKVAILYHYRILVSAFILEN